MMKKILVVDDDPYLLMSLELLMKKSGYEMIIARNGAETLELIREQKPALVILDLMMPDVDGYAICRHIKMQAPLKNIIFLFLGSKTEDVSVRQGLASAAARYMTKPFATRDLMAQVHELLSI